MIEIDVEVEILSGLHYFIEYTYWIDGHKWIDCKNLRTIWGKRGGHYKKVKDEW